MKNTLLIIFIFTISLVQAQIYVDVDFHKSSDYPLSKNKVGGLYQTPWTSAAWLERDVPKMSELESRSMRYEIGWGQRNYGNEMITKNSDGTLDFDFSAIDVFVDLVTKQNSNLVMSHGYTPKVAGDFWKNPPEDYQIFKEVNKQFAKHWKDLKLQNHYIEIWNEPDNKPHFFTTDIEAYYDVYKYATEGILEADPYAKVGGPAGALTTWHAPLLQKCKENSWPIHYISGHNYGNPIPQLNSMRDVLIEANRPDVEMLMTEYSPYIPWIGETWGGGLVERFEAALTFFNAAEIFLTYPDLTYVHWAQYIDPSRNGNPIRVDTKGDKMGLIDGNDGKRKALFNAFKIYGMMPVDRFELMSSSTDVKGFASADPNNAGIVLWNNSRLPQEVKVNLTKLPFSNGEAKLYRIDPWNSWYETGNDSLKIIEILHIHNNEFSWTGGIPELSVIFLKLDDLTGKTELALNPFAHIIRTHHWFEDRNKPAYVDFDPKTWITRLGMGDSDTGNAEVGIYAEEVPLKFNVKYQLSGNIPQKTNLNSTINLRIDFQNSSGEFEKSVLFHGGLYDLKREGEINWGTRRQADKAIKVNLSDFDVELPSFAPSDWNGKVILTYQMQNAGSGCRAKVFMRKY